MNSGAFIGRPGAGHHSAQVALSSRDDDSYALIRLARTTFQRHLGSRWELARGAKTGYSPCCTPATIVAVPPSFALGGNAVSSAICRLALREILCPPPSQGWD